MLKIVGYDLFVFESRYIRRVLSPVCPSSGAAMFNETVDVLKRLVRWCAKLTPLLIFVIFTLIPPKWIRLKKLELNVPEELVFKSNFLSRQGKKVSNADELRGFGARYRRKFALKNRIEIEAHQPMHI